MGITDIVGYRIGLGLVSAVCAYKWFWEEVGEPTVSRVIEKEYLTQFVKPD